MEGAAFSLIVGLMVESRVAIGRLGNRLDALESAHKIATAENAGRCQIHGVVGILAGAVAFAITRLL